MKKFRIAGIGCALIDYLYSDSNFNDPALVPYLSKTAYDGGLIPGGLVFLDELERFAGVPFDTICSTITTRRQPETVNLGGPAIVALLHCAQLLVSLPVDVCYYGRRGNDATAAAIEAILEKSPLDWTHYLQTEGRTPSTHVFCDPAYDHGHGERLFVNTIGVARTYTESDVPSHFFKSDLVLFGATALLPEIHDHLSVLLKRAKQQGCLTVVTTVFDFRNARKNPGAPWPLGDSDENYRNTDLLITDYDEALGLSHAATVEGAADYFIRKETAAFIITRGSDPVYLYSDGTVFGKTELTTMPVSEYVRTTRTTGGNAIGDTTGCGDNFAGGVLASIAYQRLKDRSDKIDLMTACAWGIVSGGFACRYRGGAFKEDYPGQKRELLLPVFREYCRQTGNMVTWMHDDFV